MLNQYQEVDVIHQKVPKPLDLLRRENVAIPYYKQPIVVEIQGDIPISDVFERVVFKLTHSTSGLARDIAELSGLPLEFVEMIQAKLSQEGLITEDMSPSLTEAGLKKLGALKDYDTQKVPLWCLRNALTNELIPFFTNQEPPTYTGTLDPETGRLGFYNLELNRTISSSSVGINQINQCGELSPKELQRCYHQYRLIFEKNAHKSKLYVEPLPLANLNRNPQTPELVYLVCEIHAFEGRTEFLVTDGLGSGYSDSHLEFLQRFETDLLDKFRKKLSFEDRTKSNTNSDEKVAYNSNYYMLHKLLHRTYKNLKTLDLPVTNDLEHQKYLKAKKGVIKGIYDCYEQMLYQLSKLYDIKSVQTVLKNRPPHKDRCNKIQKVIKSLGFKWNNICKDVVNAKTGQIIHFTETKGMQAGLAIAIMTAARKGNQHPFKTLAETHSFLIYHLSKLKGFRDQVSHDKQIPEDCTNEILSSSFDELTEVIQHCFPKELFPLEASEQKASFKEMMKAQKVVQVLEQALGYILIEQMHPASKQNILLAIELNKEQRADTQSQYVTSLAGVLQKVIYSSCKQVRQFAEDEVLTAKEIIERCQSKLLNTGLLEAGHSLPENLTFTSSHRIELAWKGEDSTLGANFLAFIAYQDEDCLKHLKTYVPNTVQFVSDLIAIRGHGQTDASWTEINQSIPESTFLKLIKTIMEL